MKLAQRMLSSFCANVGASNGHQWNTISGLNDVGVRVTIHKTTDAGRPDGIVLNAATSMWLPISSEKVFGFFKDERTRSQVSHIFLRYLFKGHQSSIVFSYFNGHLLSVCCFVLSFSGMFSQTATLYKRWLTSQMVHIRGTVFLFFVYALFLLSIYSSYIQTYGI